MAISVLIGYGIGRYIDRLLGTDPWFMLFFLLVGVAAGFVEYFQILKKMTDKQP